MNKRAPVAVRGPTTSGTERNGGAPVDIITLGTQMTKYNRPTEIHTHTPVWYWREPLLI